MRFEKYQGLGNDFVLVDHDDVKARPSQTWAHEVRQMCSRTLGIGGDGVLSVECLPAGSGEAAFEMRIWNSDGSIAAMCGNGLRCVGAYLQRRSMASSGQTLCIKVGAQIAGLITHGPTDLETILDLPEQGPVRQRLGEWEGTYLSLGNPHFVIETEAETPESLAEEFGPGLATADAFADGANIGFVRARDEGSLELAVWERGAGMTGACGSGACAAVIALGGKRRKVVQPGGTLEIWTDAAGVHMRGHAEFVFEGGWNVGA